MEALVVDSSVVIKWFVVEPYSAEAWRILSEYEANTKTLLAPDLLCAEVGNILWKKQRYQGLAAKDAQQILDEFHNLKFTLTSTAVLLNEAYHLAVLQRSVYDALYMALSVREGCPYVTADEKLFNAVRETFPLVVWLAEWS